MKINKPANNSRTSILRGVSTLDIKYMRMVLLFLVVIAFSGPVRAGHSILDRVDPSFNPQIQTNSFGWKWVNQIKILPDGKILALGGFNTYDRVPVGKLVRLNADGSLDTTFNDQTVTDAAIGQSNSRIFIQPDGKIVLMCIGLVAGGQGPKQLLRLNADGTFDPTFNYTQSGFIGVMVMDPLGRLLLTGNFTAPQGIRQIVRLNDDGTIDQSFDFVPAAGDSASNIVLQDDRLIVASSNNNNKRIYRLNEDGSEDPSFTPLTGSGLNLVALQPGNKILYQHNTDLLRLNENGGSDGTFQSQTLSRIVSDSFLKFTNDGKIVTVYGAFLNSGQVNQFLPNGAVDPSFTQYTQQFPASFAIQSDDSIVLADANHMSGTSGPINNFVRLTPTGVPDPTFNPGGSGFQTVLPGVIEAIETYPDGKTLLAGKFDEVNGVASYRVARLKDDSTVDNTFQINTSGTGNYFSNIRDVYQIRTQADGKIVLTGFFDYVLNGEAKKNFVRLNSDGSIDPTFNLIPPIPDWSQILIGGQNRFQIYSDGKLMVGTSKSTNGGLLGPLKLTTGGARDISFNPTLNSAATSMYIDDLVIQPDGKIVASGTYENGSSNNFKSFVARFNTDGSLDLSFPYTEEPNRLYTRLALLPSGKLLISKYVLGGGSAKVQRLNSDGSLDASFHAVSLTDSAARFNALLVLPNGKIFVGGSFTTTVNSQPARNLLQLSEDGDFEPIIYNLNNEVLCLAADSDGRVLVGGGFTVIGANGEGATRAYVARLTDSRPQFDFDGDGKTDVSVFRPGNGNWYLSQSSNGLSVQNFGLSGDVVTPGDFDGDGKADLTIWRPATGTWWYKSTVSGAYYAVQWGQDGDIPLAEDFNGDGRSDFVIYRPINNIWFRYGSNGQYAPLVFGTAGDIPLVADMDGDGKADPTIYRPSTGTWWYASSVNGLFYALQWGTPSDIPVPGDYDGDGKTDPAYFRPSNGDWYVVYSGTNYTTFSITSWGLPGDRPTPGDYDGDGKTDLAIYRPSNGMWFAMRSASGFFSQQFGLLGDKAVPNAFLSAAASEKQPVSPASLGPKVSRAIRRSLRGK